MKAGKQRFRGLAISVVALAGMVAVGTIGTGITAAQDPKESMGEAQVSQQHQASIEALSSAFRTVAKHVKPAVVQITATVENKSGKGPMQRPDLEQLPEPFREFFKDFEGTPRDPTPEYGRGSGVIIDAEQGYILTNNHVVGGKEDGDGVRVDVTLDDGREVQATIVGQDPKTDIALVKIRDSEMERLERADVELSAIQIGDSEKMQVGDWVLAIGSPFNLAQTVTQGIISAMGRQNVGIAGIEDFIQTDAAINPGNSGGPLVNMKGELIGINTAIATSGLTRGYMGIGFAIPTSMVQQILPDLKAGRPVVRGYLGVAIRGLEQEPGLARTFGLEEDRGVLIEEVRPDTPASKAGLEAEDVILAVDGDDLTSVSQLQGVVAQTKPGNTLKLTVWRDRKKITIPVEIEAQPEDFYTARNWGRSNGGGGEGGEAEAVDVASIGMSVSRVTPELAKKYNWKFEDVSGQVIVTEVEPLGEAGALRISPGDLIISVQGKKIGSPQALQKALSEEALADGVRMRIRSDYGTRTVLLQVTP